MSSDLMRRAGLAAVFLLAGCSDDLASTGKPVAEFGDSNRQTMMAQVVDPNPDYAALVPATSAQHAAKAIERYSTDTVKKPERISSTDSGSSNSSGGR